MFDDLINKKSLANLEKIVRESPNLEERISAVHLIGMKGNPLTGDGREDGALPILIKFLSDREEKIRETAASCIGYANSQAEVPEAVEGVPELIKLLKQDSSEIVRVEAARALGNCKFKVPNKELMVAILKDKSENVRIASINALYINNTDQDEIKEMKKTLKFLEQVAKSDGSKNVRDAAAKTSAYWSG